MRTSYPKKLVDLLSSLIRQPATLGPYVRHLPCWGRMPVDLELPWFSYGAIRFLHDYLRSHHRVLEFGGGGSSFFFARRVAQVQTMETHEEWHKQITALARTRALANLHCELHPLRDGQLDGYRESSFFRDALNGPWDVVAIDCFCGFSDGSYGELRRHALTVSLDQVKPGGIIVLDDSWLFPDLMQPRAGWKIHDFVSTGPCRYGVTSTAVFERLRA